MMIKKLLVFAIALVSCVGFASCGGKSEKKNFFEQLACEHVWDKGTVSVKSTCQSEGELTYTCVDCGKTKTEKTEKLKCNEASIVIDQSVGATCTMVGLTEGSYCCQCGAVVKAQEIVPALEHKDENKDDVCDVCGRVTIDAKSYLAKFTAKDAEYETTSDIQGETIAGRVYRFTGKPSLENSLKIELRTGNETRYVFWMTASESAATEDATSLFMPGVHVAKSGEYTYVYIEAGDHLSYPSENGMGYKTVESKYATIVSVVGEDIVRCTLK